MRKKYKLTGCARFLIFLLIFTPIVLIGVSIYNGNNPIDQVKDLLNIESSEGSLNNSSNDSEEVGTISESSILKEKVKVLEERIGALEKENKVLEKAIEQKDQEIQFLKQQMGNE